MKSKTQEQITYNMKQVKNKDSKIEILLRKELWNRGLRYRKNVKKILGNLIWRLLGKRLPYFATVNFGMDMTGRTEKRISKVIKTFGYQK